MSLCTCFPPRAGEWVAWGWWGPTGGHRSSYHGHAVASSHSKRAVLCSYTTPAACRLASTERAATSAEETDIDAVELPLPGADILDFSRGVTDLDAVGKEASAYADAKVCGSLPLILRARHSPGPAALMNIPGGLGIRRDCAAFPISRIKAICHCRAALWLGAQGAPRECRAEAQLCAATRKASGAELIGIFFHQKKKDFLIQ